MPLSIDSEKIHSAKYSGMRVQDSPNFFDENPVPKEMSEYVLIVKDYLEEYY